MLRLNRLQLAHLGTALWIGVLAFEVPGCGSDSTTAPASSVTDGGLDGSAGSDAGAAGFTGSDAALGSGGDAGPQSCDGETCPASFLCRYGVCVPDLGKCASYDDCPGDSYCDSNGDCIPYGVPPEVDHDPNCQRPLPPDGVQPVVQCEWLAPDEQDPTHGSVNVYTTPIVADLNLDRDPNRLQPSIIVTTWQAFGARIGTLRIFDGRTCKEQLRFGTTDDPENRPGYGTQWAVADLDNDVETGGQLEIVGLHHTGTDTDDNHPLNLYAVKLVPSDPPRAERLWYGRTCDDKKEGQPVAFSSNTANYGPGIWDIDDDGRPEILIDEMVFDADGCLLNAYSDFHYLDHGLMSAVADVDLDGSPELVRFNRIARWNPGLPGWEDEQWFKNNDAEQLPGHIAIADLGAYSTIPGNDVPNHLPEVIIASAETTTYNPESSGTIRVQDVSGKVVWGPIPLYHDDGVFGGHGGPPTASDFDGDGQVEFAAAANQYYTVYDPDCLEALGGKSPAERPGGRCNRPENMKHLPDGILWAQESHDFSSSETGSSVFDFDGDGSAEVVYGDECFVRVYKGATGEVVFSAPASSGTGFEFPTIVDVDGDFATEIVVARAQNAPDCPATDPLYRASGEFAKVGGFAVLRDPEDRWAASRPIWNQHAYSITHVTDDGRVPRASQWLPNWTQPGLNNFRQNTQGDLGKLNIADLTVVLSDVGNLCQGQAGTTVLKANVCNRGTNPVQDGVSVAFVEGELVDGGIANKRVVCSAVTTRLLTPGTCEPVECEGELSGTENVFVVVDPAGDVADCHPGNNEGAGTLQLCPR